MCVSATLSRWPSHRPHTRNTLGLRSSSFLTFVAQAVNADNLSDFFFSPMSTFKRKKNYQNGSSLATSQLITFHPTRDERGGDDSDGATSSVRVGFFVTRAPSAGERIVFLAVDLRDDWIESRKCCKDFRPCRVISEAFYYSIKHYSVSCFNLTRSLLRGCRTRWGGGVDWCNPSSIWKEISKEAYLHHLMMRFLPYTLLQWVCVCLRHP